jgi:hypothetical protein
VRKIESPEGGHEHGDLTPIRPGISTQRCAS